ncbi:ribonuclease H-like domain-containing protein [Tanacetum coccineum]
MELSSRINGVAERKNRTLIEAARTMLVDSKLPTTFWAEAVNTACYVLNKVLVIKPHNKTPYELIRGRPPLIDFMRPLGFAAGRKTNGIAGIKDNIVAGQAQKEKEPEQEYILIPLCTTVPIISQGPKDCEGDAVMKPTKVDENEASDKSGKHDQEARRMSESTSLFTTAGPSFDIAVPSTPVNTAGPSVSTANESEEQLFE